MRERIDAPEIEDDLLNRPVTDIIIDICRDLGLFNEYGVPPHKRRTPKDIADLWTRANLTRPREKPPAPKPPPLPADAAEACAEILRDTIKPPDS